MNRNGKTEILCPCKKCENKVLIDPSTGRVKMHLLKHDFMHGWWARHGEDEEDADVEGAAYEEAGYPPDEESEGGENESDAEHDEDHLDGQEESEEKNNQEADYQDGQEGRAEVQEARNPFDNEPEGGGDEELAED